MALGTKRKAANTLSKQPLDLPPATVHAFAGTTSPEGWAMCDGSEVSRSDYAALFAAIGTAYGVGDGSTTFNLPDMRGEFLRGLDNMGTAAGARGKDVDGTARTVGQTQAQATKKNGLSASQASHQHGTSTSSAAQRIAFYSSSQGTAAPVTSGSNILTGGGVGVPAVTGATTPAITIADGDFETRPVNIGINYIIKL